MPRRTPTQLPSRLLGAFGRPALRAVAARPARNGGLLGLGGAVLSGVLLTALGGPAVGASTPGGTMPAAASQASAPPVPDYVRAAEAEVGPFVAAFESYSYADAPGDLARRVAPFVTPQLQSLLAAPSQGGAGAALAAEKASATASAGTMYVESASPTRVVLLVTADIAVTSTTGNSTLERYVPLTVVQSSGGWLISDVDSLIETAPPPPPPPGSAPGAPTTPAPAPAPSASPVAPSPTPPPAGLPSHLDGIPDDYLHWYEAAAGTCPGLSWTILAAIGTVESDNGQSWLPGVHSGSNSAGAEGPMQFMPATFAYYGMVAPGGAGPADPYDPPDAIWSAARLLCADGAGSASGLYGAIFDYNHSDAYVSDVLAIASRYATVSGAGPSASQVGLGSVIVRDAESYIGTPYVWGGESPHGFDCSGLVQWVFAQAGVDMPRVAQDQYDAGPHIPAGAPLYAGDLVFFGSGPNGVEHVGIYIGSGEMVDAPHTGAVVRIEPVAGFDPPYVGATRPEIPDVSSSGPGLPVVVGAPDAHRGDGPASTNPGSSHHHHPPTTGTPGTEGAGHSTTSTTGSHRHHKPTTTTTTTVTTAKKATSTHRVPAPSNSRPTSTTSTGSSTGSSTTSSTGSAHHHRPTTSTTSTTAPAWVAPRPESTTPTTSRSRPTTTSTQAATPTTSTTSRPRPTTTTTTRPASTYHPTSTSTAPPSTSPTTHHRPPTTSTTVRR